MAKYRSLDIDKDGPQLKRLKEINAKIVPLKAKRMKLRDQAMTVATAQREVTAEIHALGNEYGKVREELLSSGLEPKLCTH